MVDLHQERNPLQMEAEDMAQVHAGGHRPLVLGALEKQGRQL